MDNRNAAASNEFEDHSYLLHNIPRAETPVLFASPYDNRSVK